MYATKLISMIDTLGSESKDFELYSQTPQYRRSWDWRKSGGIPKTAVLGLGSHIYKIQNPYLGLENGRQYWEGSGIGRGGIEGDDCIILF